MCLSRRACRVRFFVWEGVGNFLASTTMGVREGLQIDSSFVLEGTGEYSAIAYSGAMIHV